MVLLILFYLRYIDRIHSWLTHIFRSRLGLCSTIPQCLTSALPMEEEPFVVEANGMLRRAGKWQQKLVYHRLPSGDLTWPWNITKLIGKSSEIIYKWASFHSYDR